MQHGLLGNAESMKYHRRKSKWFGLRRSPSFCEITCADKTTLVYKKTKVLVEDAYRNVSVFSCNENPQDIVIKQPLLNTKYCQQTISKKFADNQLNKILTDDGAKKYLNDKQINNIEKFKTHAKEVISKEIENAKHEANANKTVYKFGLSYSDKEEKKGIAFSHKAVRDEKSDPPQDKIRTFVTSTCPSLYIASLHLKGVTLADYVFKKPENFLLNCLELLKRGKELHNLNLVHEDIHPSNVIIYEDTHGKVFAKLFDFGFSTAPGKPMPLPDPKFYPLNLDIRAPEFENFKIGKDDKIEEINANTAHDIYGLGLTLKAVLENVALPEDITSNLQALFDGMTNVELDKRLPIDDVINNLPLIIDKCKQVDEKTKHILQLKQKQKNLILTKYNDIKADCLPLIEECLKDEMKIQGIEDNAFAKLIEKFIETNTFLKFLENIPRFARLKFLRRFYEEDQISLSQMIKDTELPLIKSLLFTPGSKEKQYENYEKFLKLYNDSNWRINSAKYFNENKIESGKQVQQHLVNIKYNNPTETHLQGDFLKTTIHPIHLCNLNNFLLPGNAIHITAEKIKSQKIHIDSNLETKEDNEKLPDTLGKKTSVSASTEIYSHENLIEFINVIGDVDKNYDSQKIVTQKVAHQIIYNNSDDYQKGIQLFKDQGLKALDTYKNHPELYKKLLRGALAAYIEHRNKGNRYNNFYKFFSYSKHQKITRAIELLGQIDKGNYNFVLNGELAQGQLAEIAKRLQSVGLDERAKSKKPVKS